MTPRTGRVYLSAVMEEADGRLFLLPTNGLKERFNAPPPKPLVIKGMERTKVAAECLAVSPDEATLAADFGNDAWLYALRIEADGTLKYLQPYWSLQTRPGYREAVHDLAFDRAGRLFAATNLGIQFFDPTGRLSGVLPYPGGPTPKPEKEDDAEMKMERAITFGGPDFNRFYVASGNKVFVRTLNTKGVPPPK